MSLGGLRIPRAGWGKSRGVRGISVSECGSDGGRRQDGPLSGRQSGFPGRPVAAVFTKCARRRAGGRPAMRPPVGAGRRSAVTKSRYKAVPGLDNLIHSRAVRMP